MNRRLYLKKKKAEKDFSYRLCNIFSKNHFSVSFFTASIIFLSDRISRKAQSVTAQKESLQGMCSSLERDILYCACKWFTRSRIKMVDKSFTNNRISVLASTFLGFLFTNMYYYYFFFISCCIREEAEPLTQPNQSTKMTERFIFERILRRADNVLATSLKKCLF